MVVNIQIDLRFRRCHSHKECSDYSWEGEGDGRDKQREKCRWHIGVWGREEERVCDGKRVVFCVGVEREWVGGQVSG
jgi:hypothetical protein